MHLVLIVPVLRVGMPPVTLRVTNAPDGRGRKAIRRPRFCATADGNHVYPRITLRFTPFTFICYLFNYLDRVKVGFAKLQMLDALTCATV